MFCRAALIACAAATACAPVRPRPPERREIAVVAAESSPRTSVAHGDDRFDPFTLWVPALLFPPLIRDAAQQTARFVADVRVAHALRAQVGPDLNRLLADAVLVAAHDPGVRLVRADPAEDRGCAAPPPMTSSPETLHLAVVWVTLVREGGPDAPLGLTVGVRSVLRGPAGCAERTLLVASGEVRPFEEWDADGQRELLAELRAQIASAGPRILGEIAGAPPTSTR